MKKIYSILFTVFVFSTQTIYCQLDTINNYYFTNLKESLTKDSNVKDVKLVQEQILKGQGFIQSMYVKYKNDPKGRFYHVGKEFIYNTRDNSLGFIGNANVKTQILTDTTFSFTEDGEIGLLEIYNLPYDSVITFKRGNNIWSGIFGNYYEKIPNVYKTIEYSCNRDTIIESIYKYSPLDGFVLNGDVIYRNSNWDIVERIHYTMGTKTPILPEDKKGEFIDIRDGHRYTTIKINNQIWLSENLVYKPDHGKFWAFNGNEDFVLDYGYLYSWETAQDVCPNGWHLPKKSEYEELLLKYNEDGKLAYNDLSLKGESGFNLKSGGFKYNINYILLREGAFWTATENGKRKAWLLRSGGIYEEVVLTDHLSKKCGLSVRCIKNE